MSYTFELNNERKDANFVSGKIKSKSPVVEVFSAMTNGKDLAPFGKKGDVAAKYIKELNSKASSGDPVAVSELNELRRFVMQPILLQEISDKEENSRLSIERRKDLIQVRFSRFAC